MSLNWVMLNQNGFVKLANERIIKRLESRISCELSVPSELRDRCASFHRKSDRGTLFLTTNRLIYLPARPVPEFESFSAPIYKLQDSITSTSVLWGWVWKSDCIPVSGGGIPAEIPRVEVKLTFSDGGMMEFNEAYIVLRERLLQHFEMRPDPMTGLDTPDEPLPAYEAEGAPSVPPPPAVASLVTPTTREQRSDSSASRRPDEPPPDYDEAQAQHISIRLEDHIRDEANRGDGD